MIGYASYPHMTDHLTPLGIEVTDRRPIGQSHVVVASRGDARKLQPQKDCAVAVVEHGAGQRYHMDAGGPETPHPNVTLFLAPSLRVGRQSAHLFPNAETVVVGSPRVEQLVKLRAEALLSGMVSKGNSIQSRPPRVVLAFHWNSPVAPEARSAWPHYQRILPVLQAAGFDVLGHGHPRYRSKLRPWYERHSVEWQPDWAECVRQADCLVVDNSSIMWEACALDIPVVVLNAPWYRKDVDFGLRFWSKATIGPHVDHPAELVDAIEQVLTRDRYQLRRKRAAEYVYDQVDGATEEAQFQLDYWASL